ncbi:MAG: nucleoside triphosphate pyrophosphohydrolase [Chloroflexi bacterium]|nr:nucleoside triphosphate pyrophosphohydrolase [Chloroflexota bacterium]
MTLTIVGLGPGSLDDLSRRAWRTLKAAKTVYLRTGQHGCVPCLPQNNGQTYHTFDGLYETLDDFAAVYAAIVERVLEAARTGDVVYAVPGDPLVGEATVTQLMAKAREAGVAVEIVSGISFVEPALALLGVDALDGLQVLDGIGVAAMHHPPLNPDYPALLGQVYSRAVAADVKLTLMNQYPDDFPVKLIHEAGTENALVEALPLYEIDRSAHIRHMTALYVPALGRMSSFEQFQEVIAHLRAPEGCPWDRKQTHQSLRQYLLEETYEALEALDSEDMAALAGELGDLLLQIGLHAQIATEAGEFTMADVISRINRKLVHRHPHVWGDVNVSGADEVVKNWQELKREEQAEAGQKRESLLDGVPAGLPALMAAYRYQGKAAGPGFDWERLEDVMAHFQEELAEVLAAQTDAEKHEEVGDLLFMMVNLARWLEVEPETALREANAKFYRRFRYVEEAVKKTGRPMEAFSLAELDGFWKEAKAGGL